MEAIRSLADVRPGDIYLGPIGGPLGAAIRAAEVVVDGGWRVGPLHVEHIGIVVEASPEGLHQPRMVQAMPHGAEEIELSCNEHWTPKVAYARIPEDWLGQAADAAAIARLMVAEGVAYSYASYAALWAYRWGFRAPRLTKWIGRRRPEALILDSWSEGIEGRPRGGRLPVEAICSVLADQCWTLAGKRVMDDAAPQAVTPSMLGRQLLTGMEGVIWGWPKAL